MSAAGDPATGAATNAAPGAGVAGPIRGSRGGALRLATLGFFGGFAGLAIFGPLVPRFTELLHLDPVGAGVLAAIPSLLGALLRIPFGAAVDRFGGRAPLLALLVLADAGVIGLLALLATSYPDHMAGTYPLLILLGSLIGCGVATFSVGIAQVSYWYPKRSQGSALGLYAGLGNTAPGLSTLVLPLAVGSIGLLGAYGTWFALLLGVTIVYAVFVEDAPAFQLRRRGIAIDEAGLAALGGGETAPHGSATAGLRAAAAVPATWALVFFYFVCQGGFLAFTTWLPTFWHAMYGAPLRDAGILTAVFSLTCALVRIGGGLLSDRVSIRYALLGNFLVMGAGTVVLGLSETFEVSLVATLVVGVGMGLQNAIVFKLLPGYVPGAVGGASGWIGGLGALGGFAIPPVLGLATSLIGGPAAYSRGFLPFAVLVAATLPAVFWLDRWNARRTASA
jgi:MFS transporter, NNP family, nitrate/nitrite transporter